MNISYQSLMEEQAASPNALYLCECAGCGWASERMQYCADHTTAIDRAECQIEFAASDEIDPTLSTIFPPRSSPQRRIAG
jgi:hypothetical protein